MPTRAHPRGMSADFSVVAELTYPGIAEDGRFSSTMFTNVLFPSSYFRLTFYLRFFMFPLIVVSCMYWCICWYIHWWSLEERAVSLHDFVFAILILAKSSAGCQVPLSTFWRVLEVFDVLACIVSGFLVPTYRGDPAGTAATFDGALAPGR